MKQHEMMYLENGVFFQHLTLENESHHKKWVLGP